MQQIKLGAIIQQIRGVSYKPTDVKDASDPNAVALLRANNIQDSGLNFEDLVYVDKQKVSVDQIIRKGDILICASSGSKNLVGKAAVADCDLPYAFGAFCKIVRVKAMDAAYVGQFFQSPRYRREISAASAGANINNIRNEHIDNMLIAVYSDAEQREIAKKLLHIDNLIRGRQEQLVLIDQLVKSRFIELFGDPEQNSKEWPVRLLGELCSVGSSKRIYQNEQSHKGIPFWRISDLVSKMDTGTADSDLFIPVEKYLELKQAGLVPAAGDILVTSRGTLGRCYIIKAEDCFYFQDGMISWLSKFSDEITPLYLQYLFTMSGFRKQIDSMQAGSTVAYLSIAMLKKLQTMVPSRDAQEQFAAFVEQTDKSKLAVQKGLQELEILKKSLMQQYFG